MIREAFIRLQFMFSLLKNGIVHVFWDLNSQFLGGQIVDFFFGTKTRHREKRYSAKNRLFLENFWYLFVVH